MAMYRVVPGSVNIHPSKSQYTTEEPVELHVKAELERKDGFGAWLTWQSRYIIWDDSGHIIEEEMRTHSCAPWTSLDSAVDDFVWNVGKFNPGTYNWTVVISASG